MVASHNTDKSMFEEDVAVSPFGSVAVPDRNKLGCPCGLSSGHMDQKENAFEELVNPVKISYY